MVILYWATPPPIYTVAAWVNKGFFPPYLHQHLLSYSQLMIIVLTWVGLNLTIFYICQFKYLGSSLHLCTDTCLTWLVIFLLTLRFNLQVFFCIYVHKENSLILFFWGVFLWFGYHGNNDIVKLTGHCYLVE